MSQKRRRFDTKISRSISGEFASPPQDIVAGTGALMWKDTTRVVDIRCWMLRFMGMQWNEKLTKFEDVNGVSGLVAIPVTNASMYPGKTVFMIMADAERTDNIAGYDEFHNKLDDRVISMLRTFGRKSLKTVADREMGNGHQHKSKRQRNKAAAAAQAAQKKEERVNGSESKSKVTADTK